MQIGLRLLLYFLLLGAVTKQVVSLFVCSHTTTQGPLNGFSHNRVFGGPTYVHIPNLVKIGKSKWHFT